jgi:hypothetical protein
MQLPDIISRALDKMKEGMEKGQKPGGGKTEAWWWRQKRKRWFSRWVWEKAMQALRATENKSSFSRGVRKQVNKQGLGGSQSECFRADETDEKQY